MSIMVDLETAGTQSKSIIFSIGAVKFNKHGVHDRFHVGIDPVSCEALGLKMSASTFTWWLAQPDVARASLLERLDASNAVDLATALAGFNLWAMEDNCPGGPRIYGNGATFDNMLLRDAYTVTGLDYPSKFWNDLCYRTIKTLAPQIKLVRTGTHHSAVDDAESQARHMIEICAHLNVDF